MTKTPDVLDSPAIRRRTERVLALKEKIIRAESGLAFIIADLGDELVATKAALDKNTWILWLSRSVNFTVQTADNYMNVARLRRRFKIDFKSFARLGPTDLYLIADLPDALIKRLAKDPRLPDPRTGRLVPIQSLSERDFKKALQVFRRVGRRRGSGRGAPPQGEDREHVAADIIRDADALTARCSQVRAAPGKLSSATKGLGEDAAERLRVGILKWPAWLTPQKGRRLRRR